MRRAVSLVVIALFLVLALGGAAFAQTPQDIYDDFAADNDLDGNYTDAQLEGYLGDALVHQYGDPTILTALDAAVRGILSGRTSFPFTGVHLVLMALGAGALAAGGVGLRRLARQRG
ncbi:MAG: hypothetical protein JXA87_05280 [Thermoleophilia bacterium]|nr:hypothetical protein [Thermoleophilia bacterium]